MITMDDQQRVTIKVVLDGGGERLLGLQKALILGMQEIGTNKHFAGEQDFANAVNDLAFLLNQIQLDMSQVNVALGGKPYAK